MHTTDSERGFGDEPPGTFLLVADRITFEHAEHPLIVVDLFAEPGRTRIDLVRHVLASVDHGRIAQRTRSPELMLRG